MTTNDAAEIAAVVNLYAFAVDTQVWDLFDRVFTEDARTDYGPGASWPSRADIKRDFAFFHAPLQGSQHTVTNHLAVVNGDTAHAISYIHVRLMRQMPGGDNHWESGGYYDDQLVRTTDGWRITARRWRGNWWKGNPQVGEPVPEARFDPAVVPLKRAAEEGSLSFLKALSGGK